MKIQQTPIRLSAEPKYEADVRGRGESSDSDDPKHYVLLGARFDGTDAIICDTLNCDHTFSLDDSRKHMDMIANAMNDSDALRDALAAAYKFISQPTSTQRLSTGGMRSTYNTNGYNELMAKIRAALKI